MNGRKAGGRSSAWEPARQESDVEERVGDRGISNLSQCSRSVINSRGRYVPAESEGRRTEKPCPEWMLDTSIVLYRLQTLCVSRDYAEFIRAASSQTPTPRRVSLMPASVPVSGAHPVYSSTSMVSGHCTVTSSLTPLFTTFVSLDDLRPDLRRSKQMDGEN